MKNNFYYNMGGDLRSLLGYSQKSPWKNAPYNFIHTPNGSITMKNTKKELKAFDGNTGKFLAKLKPGKDYKFDTNNILEVPYYKKGGKMRNCQQGGLINDCPPGYVKDESGQCIEDNGYNPTQSQQKGAPIQSIIKPLQPQTTSIFHPEAEFDNGLADSNPAKNIGAETAGDYRQPLKKKKDPRPPFQNVVNTSQMAIGAVHAGLTMFGNYLEEARQKKWMQQQMANNFNQTYSTAQNDYGVDPYEQTGQLRPLLKYGGIHINPANKGKFNATKARTGKTTEELTHSSNPLTRKRAIFAQNAAKWNHQKGGKFNILDYLYGDDEDEQDQKATITSTSKKKQPTRVTENEIDSLSMAGVSIEDLLDNYNQSAGNSSSSAPKGFRSFATYAEGKQALYNQLELYKTGKTRTGLKPNSSLYEAMAKYAPASDNNNPKAYAEFIAKKLNVNPNTPISSLDTKGWADAIEKMEGNKSGNNPGNLRPYQKGGVIDIDEQEIQRLINLGYKIERL